MISINRIVLLQIFLVLFLSSFHKVKGGLFVRNRVYVELFNDLGLNVTVHCKSGHNDLGSHFIQYPNGFYQFNFKPNTFGTSDYYCNFQWPNNFHWFDIYLFDRDHPQCSKCFWKIRPDGVCKLNYETNSMIFAIRGTQINSMPHLLFLEACFLCCYEKQHSK